MRRNTNPTGKARSPLDHVGVWFIKAMRYPIGATRNGFVDTNSTTPRERVALLWPEVFASGYEISNAHRTYECGPAARGKAHVNVVIFGLNHAGHSGARLADHYDPDLMSANQRKAHQANGRAVDRMCRQSNFDSDRERVEHLFALHE